MSTSYKKEVSVCIPCFNGEKFIEQTINAALKQTKTPLEVLVYDDGSTDKSIEIASKYKVKIIRGKENRGIGFARKRLVEEASGKYICFVSADDIMMPDCIEELLKASKSCPNSIVYCDYIAIDENGNFISEFKADTYDNEEEWIMANIFKARANTMSVCYNIFAPAKILKENNFDGNLRYGEDLEHLLRCTLVKKIKYLHMAKILFSYRIHMKSTTTVKNKNIPENNKKIFQKINKMMGREVI